MAEYLLYHSIDYEYICPSHVDPGFIPGNVGPFVNLNNQQL